jgi:chromosome segregation ATPase
MRRRNPQPSTKNNPDKEYSDAEGKITMDPNEKARMELDQKDGEIESLETNQIKLEGVISDLREKLEESDHGLAKLTQEHQALQTKHTSLEGRYAESTAHADKLTDKLLAHGNYAVAVVP